MNDNLVNITQYENRQIDILLSTYNGSKYLQELLLSLLGQTYKNWKLFIRDDGSTDRTMDIINHYTKEYPNKIIYINDTHHHLGTSQSFSKLLAYSQSEFIMFCDQDDVWLKYKIEVTLEKMVQLEKESPNQPLLVHTDLVVVDKDLQIISNSFWRYQKLNPSYDSLNNILVQNVVTGCTMMMNRRLKELSYPIADNAIMHDWWIALVASIYSGIYYVRVAPILYRQHDGNNIGAQGYTVRNFISRYDKVKDSIKNLFKQGNQLREIYNSHLNKDQFELIEKFLQMYGINKFARLKNMNTYGFKKHGVIRNLAFISIMFFIKEEVLNHLDAANRKTEI
jgi:glycosyltransferase involved in cell wall biosynthesis